MNGKNGNEKIAQNCWKWVFNEKFYYMKHLVVIKEYESN